ncbi:MAG: hypothetical protein ABI456_25695 [Ktedonobacteraceae bacterium]|nr:hypothetical protein [Chloroflexota bacterium]
MSNRTAFYSLLIIAILAWVGLVLFTRFVPPHTALAFMAFFVLLSVALICTLSPLAYAVSLRFVASRLYHATIRHALRQGALLTLCIVLNLVLLALHSWNIFTALVILGAAIIIEVLSLARK